MDKETNILLNSLQNVNSVNSDMYDKLELSNNLLEINEYDIKNIASITEIFNAEREENTIYRIYGRIEYMSLLNGLTNNYINFQDFFNPQTTDCKNILNSFDFYLVKPFTGYTKIDNTAWIRYFQVIATPDDFEIYPIGFSNNVFGEQIYSYNFNIDIDATNYYDDFGMPITELFLYAQYKRSTNPNESMSGTSWQDRYTPTNFNLVTKTLNIGDLLKSLNGYNIGDLIEYDNLQYNQSQLYTQQFYIKTPYSGGNITWKYNPLISIRLRYLSNSLYQVNTGSTSYDLVQSMPSYATKIDNNGNYVWRNIMPDGYIDQLTGLGTDYPFVNKKRYLFSTLLLSIQPDLNDSQTLNAFSDVWFSRNAINSNITPISDINNIGKPCQ